MARTDEKAVYSLIGNNLTVSLEDKHGRQAARAFAYDLLTTGNKSDKDTAHEIFKKVGTHES